MADEIDLMDDFATSKSQMVLFFMIDTSGSMSGSKIGTVNTVMEETIPEVRTVGGADTEIKVAVLTFDSECNWMYDQPISIESFQWSTLSAHGMTYLGDACRELNSKLSRKVWMNAPSLSYAPVIILLSDGAPNDDWESGIEVLKKNSWFKHALKFAVAVGDDCDKNVLSFFTGDPEAVVQVNNGKALAKMLRFITVKSSEIGSQSQGSNNDGTQLTPEAADTLKQDMLNQQVQDIVSKEDLDYDDAW